MASVKKKKDGTYNLNLNKDELILLAAILDRSSFVDDAWDARGWDIWMPINAELESDGYPYVHIEGSIEAIWELES